MTPGLVSVVIPVFNGEAYLRQAVESVLKQTYPLLEVVAVDDGSSDRSPDILDAYGDPVRVIRQARGGNVGLVRASGIQHARGEFIAFLDQDDWWHPEKVARQVYEMRADSEVGLVHTGVKYVDDRTGNESRPLVSVNLAGQIAGACYERLLFGNGIVNSSVMVRKSVLDAVGMIDEQIPGNTVQDYALWLRIAKEYRVAFVDDALTNYRLHGAQGLWNRQAMLEAEAAVLLRARPEWAWRITAEGRKRLGDLFDELAVAYLECGAMAQARTYFRSAFKMEQSMRRFFRYLSSLCPVSAVNVVRATKASLMGPRSPRCRTVPRAGIGDGE